jgi:asparagine synthase (glutamine-hydrolysing)
MRAALGAIVRLDGAPLAPSELRFLAAQARLPAPGAPLLLAADTAGLIAVPVGSAAASPAPPEPDPDPQIAVVVDGTIDNRAALALQLGLPPWTAAPAGAARLLAAAYERWGDEVADHLHGDCAFLLWDRRRQRLLAARDACGQRELFYTSSGDRLCVGSQLSMVAGRPTLGDLDPEYVADFLASPDAGSARTPWKHVHRLAAGHQLTAGRQGIAIRRWWQPAPPPWPHDTPVERGVSRFQELFGDAVRHALASGGRVWAELSGGLDSSSIVCVAHDLLRAGRAAAPDFATLTYVWDESPQCDERRYTHQVVARHALRNHELRCDGLFFDQLDEECRFRNEPHFGILGAPMLAAGARLLREHQVAVLLSGARAESVVLDEQVAPVHMADHLRRGRARHLLADLLAWHRVTQMPLANLLWSHTLRPLVGRRHRASLEPPPNHLDPWVDRRFAAALQLVDRRTRPRAERRFPAVARQQQYEFLLRSEQAMARGSLDWTLEIRHPFLHRPLVELALALPWRDKLSPHEGKLVLRRAMAGLLPDALRTRVDHSGPGADLYKTLARRWPAVAPFVESSLLAQLGYVDAAALRRTAELARFGAADRFTAFLSCVAFEAWLRCHATDARPAAGATGAPSPPPAAATPPVPAEAAAPPASGARSATASQAQGPPP